MARTRTARTPALLIASALLAASAAFGLAGCASSTGTKALPPVIADLGTVDGATLQVPMGGSIDLTGDDKTFTSWKADIADPKILSFTPGKDDGSAQFNPGLEPLAEGTTKVALANSASGDRVAFTVEVTPKK